MNKILKALFFFIALGLFIGSIVSFKSTNPIGEKIIGFSVLIGAFIFLPLFLTSLFTQSTVPPVAKRSSTMAYELNFSRAPFSIERESFPYS